MKMSKERTKALEALAETLRQTRIEILSVKLEDDFQEELRSRGNTEDHAENSQYTEQLEIHSRLAVVENEKIIHIDEALERLAKGEYGRCEDCDHEISIARLEALPYAIRCLRCQESFDQSN